MVRGKKSLMSEEVLERTVSELARVQSHPVYLWHGGESLLVGKNFYERIVELQKEHGVEGARNAVQTNGTLIDDEWVQFFNDHNFTIGVSVDGNQQAHDRLRVYQNGRGSHSAVMRGIERVQDGSGRLGVLVVVTQQSVAYPREIFSFLLMHGLTSVDFKPCYGDPRFDVSLIDFADFLNAIFDEWVELDDPKVSVRTLEGYMMNLLGGGSGLCNLSGHCTDIVTVDYDGTVYACDRYMAPDKVYGNLMQQPLDEIVEESPAAVDFKARVSALRQKCITCSYQKVCRGGCTQEREYWPDQYCQHRAMVIDHIGSWLTRQGMEVVEINNGRG